jgi:hypothetical protein
MSRLVTTRNLRDADGVYARLIAAQEGMSEAESAAFQARLILTLVNHIGDEEAVAEAIALAADPAAAAGR